jgi:hypothetical protein
MAFAEGARAGFADEREGLDQQVVQRFASLGAPRQFAVRNKSGSARRSSSVARASMLDTRLRQRDNRALPGRPADFTKWKTC